MNLYELKNELGSYYVLADHPTQAQQKLETLLKEADYGFTDERKTKSITLLTSKVDQYNGKPNFSSSNRLII